MAKKRKKKPGKAKPAFKKRAVKKAKRERKDKPKATGSARAKRPTPKGKARKAPKKTPRKKASGARKPKGKGKRPKRKQPRRKQRAARGVASGEPASRTPTHPDGSEDIPQLAFDAAMAAIQARLDLAAELGRVRVWPYADGSIDGEVLAKLPRGKSASDILLDIEEAIGREGLDGIWVSVGVRYTIKEDEEVYRRFKGYNDVNTHFQRAIATNVAEVFVIGRHEIAAGMENKYGRKADSVYVRLHWNPDGTKPEEREVEHVGGKAKS